MMREPIMVVVGLSMAEVRVDVATDSAMMQMGGDVWRARLGADAGILANSARAVEYRIDLNIGRIASIRVGAHGAGSQACGISARGAGLPEKNNRSAKSRCGAHCAGAFVSKPLVALAHCGAGKIEAGPWACKASKE